MSCVNGFFYRLEPLSASAILGPQATPNPISTLAPCAVFP